MKVLADYHHHDLWESLELLCARLGWDLYRPMGMDWFTTEWKPGVGYWNLERAWHGDAVAKQYLTPWGDDVRFGDDPTPVQRYDHSHNRDVKLLTLDRARDLKPDIVIASVAHNHEGFGRFASEVGATFGLQLGNVRFSPQDMLEDRWDLASFGLISAILPGPVPVPNVTYHQEFSLDSFRHEPPVQTDPMVIASFVNCFPENPQAYESWKRVAAERAQYRWQVYGAYGQVPEDQYACGNINVCAEVGDAMRASDIAWHTKQWSDGYGHVIHNWFAVGRPVIGHEWYYRSQLAGPLWQEGVTSFDISNHTVEDVTTLIDRLYNDPDLRLRMSENAAKRFREVVDFDEEEQAIRRMFEAVL